MNNPLSGACIYVLTNAESKMNMYGQAAEEEDTVMITITALGGNMTQRVEDATHALWWSPQCDSLALTRKARLDLLKCHRNSIPIVDGSWLEQVASLTTGEHWSDVDVESHVAPVVALMHSDSFIVKDHHQQQHDADDIMIQNALEASRQDEAIRQSSAMAHDDTSILYQHFNYISNSNNNSNNNNNNNNTNQNDTQTNTDQTRPKMPSRKKSVTFAPSNTAYAPEHSSIPLQFGSAKQTSFKTSSSSSTTFRKKSPPKEHHPKHTTRDRLSQMSHSIKDTYDHLLRESPAVVEDDAIRRAMELSMLDFALVDQRSFKHSPFSTQYTTTPQDSSSSSSLSSLNQKNEKTPHEILGIEENATPAEIRAMYRKKALQTHPDREGGSDEAFHAIARAYRTLLHLSSNNNDSCDNSSKDFNHSFSDNNNNMSLKSSAHWDSELKEHRNLVKELFTNHGENIVSNIKRQQQAMKQLNLRPMEAGSSNVNERNESIRNSCFYLSLATSYLHGIGAITCDFHDDNCTCASTEEERALFGCSKTNALHAADKALQSETALQLKRMIESAVVSSHPEWVARGMVGEEVQAFSDFLVYVLDSFTLISDWAVVVFDSLSGFVEVYKGKNYHLSEEGGDGSGSTGEGELDAGNENDDGCWSASNTITVRYIEGHYQPLLSKVKEVQEDEKKDDDNNNEEKEESKNATTDNDDDNSIESEVAQWKRPNLKQILETLDQNGVFYVVTDGSE